MKRRTAHQARARKLDGKTGPVVGKRPAAKWLANPNDGSHYERDPQAKGIGVRLMPPKTTQKALKK